MVFKIISFSTTKKTCHAASLYFIKSLHKKYSLSSVGIVIRVSPIFTLRRQSTFGYAGHNKKFGKSGLRKAPLFGERTNDGAIRERIARSALNEQSPRGRGVDPLRHQQTVDSDIFWIPRLDLSCDNSVNSRVLWRWWTTSPFTERTTSG